MLVQQTVERLLIVTIRAGVFFILFLPLVMNSQFFFPFIVPKNVFFRIAVEVLFALWIILAQMNTRYRPNLKSVSPLTWAVVSFFAVNVVAALAGIGLYNSFWGNYERMSGLFHHLHLVLYFIVLVNVFKTLRPWQTFLSFSVFVSLLMTFLAYAQWLGVSFLLQSSGGERLTATLGNPTFFAAYLLFNIFFILYFLVKPKRFDLKMFASSFLVSDAFLVLAEIFGRSFPAADWGAFNMLRTPILTAAMEHTLFFWSFVVLQVLIFGAWFLRQKKYVVASLLTVFFLFEFFIFFNTQTRGALLGFAAGIGFLALVTLFVRVDKRLKLASAVFLVLLVLAPFVLVASKNTAWVKNNDTLRRLATISLTDITTESRLLTWQASWRGWAESPKSFLIGYGPENYYYAFNKYFPVQIYKDAGSQIWFDRAHNVIFDVGVTSGIVGIGVYLAILGIAVRMLFGAYRQGQSFSANWLLISFLIAYLIQNLFVFDTLSTELLIYLLLAFIIYATRPEANEETQVLASAGQTAKISYLFAASVAVVLITGIFAINVQTLRANHSLFLALADTGESRSFSTKVDLLKQAINEANVGVFEARQQFASYVAGAVRNASGPSAPLQTAATAARQEMQKSIAEEPQNIRHHLWLAGYLNNIARLDPTTIPQAAVALLEDQSVVALSPTRPQIYFELGQAHLLLGNTDQAGENFRKAVELSPTVFDTRINLITFYVISSQYDKADGEVRETIALYEGRGGVPVDFYQHLVNVYGRVEQYQLAITYQELVVSGEAGQGDYDPTADDYAQLAALYARVGENKKAIAATEAAVALDPNFAAQAQTFIEQIKSGELLAE